MEYILCICSSIPVYYNNVISEVRYNIKYAWHKTTRKRKKTFSGKVKVDHIEEDEKMFYFTTMFEKSICNFGYILYTIYNTCT